MTVSSSSPVVVSAENQTSSPDPMPQWVADHMIRNAPPPSMADFVPSPSPVVGWAEQAKARCEAATPGPWDVDFDSEATDITAYRGTVIATMHHATVEQNRKDAWFMADARTDLPRALEALEEERDENRKLTILLRQQTINHTERDAGWANAERAEAALEVAVKENNKMRKQIKAVEALDPMPICRFDDLLPSDYVAAGFNAALAALRAALEVSE